MGEAKGGWGAIRSIVRCYVEFRTICCLTFYLGNSACIAHLEKDMAVAMCSEQGVYFQEGGCQRYRDREWYHVGEHTEANGIDQLASPTLLPFSSRILEMIVLNFTDDGSSSDPRWHGDAPSVQRQDG